MQSQKLCRNLCWLRWLRPTHWWARDFNPFRSKILLWTGRIRDNNLPLRIVKLTLITKNIKFTREIFLILSFCLLTPFNISFCKVPQNRKFYIRETSTSKFQLKHKQWSLHFLKIYFNVYVLVKLSLINY